jgi:hypothetical protein
MRFVEFKLPEKDSPLFNQIFSELSELVELTKDLPEENAVRQQVDAYLEKLKQNVNVAEDAVEDAEDALLIAIAKKFGGPQATMALMDIKKFKKLVQNEVAQVGTLHQEKGKEQVKTASTEKLEKAKKLAVKIGKDSKWGISLNNVLAAYENEQLQNDFLDLCLANQGLTKPFNSNIPYQKLNLKNIINSKLSGLFADQEAFTGLALLPLSDGTGQGSGVGPGEAVFACLAPDAKKAVKSDLTIGGFGTVEVKGGKNQESTGWLDATGVKATDLRSAFLSIVNPALRSKGREKFKFADGTNTTLNDIIDNADFRPEKFRELKTVFKLLSPEDQIKTIDALYKEVAPTVKTNPETKKLYNRYVKETVKLITNITNQSELIPINKLQAKLSMIEYAIGAYKAETLLIYNYVTQDIILIHGIDGIEQSITSPDLITTAITMRGTGAKKGSPGISIKTRDVRSRTKEFN